MNDGPPGFVDDGPTGVLVGPTPPVGPTGMVPLFPGGLGPPVGCGPLPVPGLPVPDGSGG